MGRKRIYATSEEADAARVLKTRLWHESFSPVRMPWRVIVDTIVVAVFAQERDARGFAKARYGDGATVEQRRGRGPYGPARESNLAVLHG